MKQTLLSSALCSAILFGLTAIADAQISPYKLRVEQVSKTDKDKKSKTQERSLKIFVSNSAREPAELVAKYIFLGREFKGRDLVKLDEGERPVSVAALGTGMAETPVASTTMSEGKGSKNKKPEPSGYNFIGFGVRLFQADKLVAEYYDPPSAKDEWEKAPLKK
jgi:hypothetical protein